MAVQGEVIIVMHGQETMGCHMETAGRDGHKDQERETIQDASYIEFDHEKHGMKVCHGI